MNTIYSGDTLGSLVVLLNDNTKMTDPLGSDRVGSFCFTEDQDLNFTRSLPKLQAVFSDSSAPDNRTYGQRNKHDKYLTINVYIYVKRNTTYGGYRNSSFVKYIEEEIENAVVRNQSSLGKNHLVGFGEVVSVGKHPDHDIFYGVKPIMFKYRKSFA